MWVIDRDKLEAEIDRRGDEIDRRVARGAICDEEILLHSAALAEHNALVAVFKSLTERKTIWDNLDERGK